MEKKLIQAFNTTLETFPLDSDYKSSSCLEYAELNLLQKRLYDLQASNTITSGSIQK
jgi:hypothetical protein